MSNNHIRVMGEARRKAALRKSREVFSKPMKPARFDLLALGTRGPLTSYMSVELSHWCDLEERVLGAVIFDTTDEDYGWVLLARDRIGRFRCVSVGVDLTSERAAQDALRQRIAIVVEENDFDALGDQGDETNYATDVLTVPPGTKSDDLHPHFRVLMESPGRHPSRAVFREIAPWLAPADPHFVSEFQFRHFDQRLWEMFLWAALRELGFDVTQPEAPDFHCQGVGFSFTVEATTVGPSTAGVLADHPQPTTPEELAEFLKHYMPMKFGSALTSKLNKKDAQGRSYWQRGDAVDRPFCIAIADFHIPGGKEEPGSMTYTASALWPYLYGHRITWEMLDDHLVARAVRSEEHVYKGKVVETGFFDLPGAENISAIIFSNAGTLSKFDRMGIAAGFVPDGHKYFRMGVRYNHAPNAVEPTPFFEEVGVDGYQERWSDELQVFHNPNAIRPLPEDVLPGVTHHYFRDGRQVSLTPEKVTLASHTIIMTSKQNAPLA